MPKTVHLTHEYDATPEAVWEVVTDLDALARAVDGLILYDGLPTGRIHEGQDLAVRFSLFGRLPWQDYHMRVVLCDDAAHEFRSEEHGGAVKAWRHHLRVLPHGAGARVEEEIEIEAGPMTPLYRLWARFMYRRRHAPRVAMLAERARG